MSCCCLGCKRLKRKADQSQTDDEELYMPNSQKE